MVIGLKQNPSAIESTVSPFWNLSQTSTILLLPEIDVGSWLGGNGRWSG
jgi:hypothetical protein